MTHEQVIDLLTMIASFDQRTLGEADVVAWHAVATQGGWTFEAARDAVIRHHTDDTERIKPAHITRLIRAERSKPAPPTDVVALPSAPSATAEHRQAAIAQFAASFAKRVPGGPVRPGEGDLRPRRSRGAA